MPESAGCRESRTGQQTRRGIIAHLGAQTQAHAGHYSVECYCAR
jgi:hypothetical protein